MRCRFLVSLAAILALGTAATCGDKKVDDDLPCHRVTSRVFSVIAAIEPENVNSLDRVRLYVSTDKGRTWQKAGEERAKETIVFSFTAPKDAEYWFAVQSVDKDGKTEPKGARKFRPQVRIILDTDDKA
jgi:hypothetical protein